MLTRSISSSVVPFLQPEAVAPAPKPPEGAPGRAGAPVRRDRPGSPGGAAPPAAVAPSAPRDPASLAGLAACVEEARMAASARGEGPPDPASYPALRSRLEKAAGALPPAYRRAVAEPLLATLEKLGARGYARLLAEDPGREGAAGLLLDLAQAVLQRGEGYQALATGAFQEVVSDLYEGFLSAEDRRGVRPPDHGVLPPLVRWGSAEAGPYTWPVTDTAAFGAGAPVVSLPAPNATRGLLAWAALGHETAGHDILAADEGLRDELGHAVRRELLAAKAGPALAGYWSERIDEAASDVLGVLNMGPAAAVGLIGYFRSLNGAWAGRPLLRNVGRQDDPHPADIARAYLAAETVRLLSFDGAGRWADRLVAEADRDLGQVRLGGVAVSAAAVKAQAAAVARAVVRTRLDALEGHALGEIQDWRDRDEAVVAALRRRLSQGGAAAGAGRAATPASAGSGTRGQSAGAGEGTPVVGAYAAHAVAAAVYEAVAGASRPDRVLDRMVGLLAEMHERNPAWRAAGGPGPASAGEAA